MAVWFTSDTHFGHIANLSYSNRPFKDIQEHDNLLINNWNSRVQIKDEVYHLGDVSFLNPKDTANILRRLKGRIYLIKGNHDSKSSCLAPSVDRFEWVKDVHFLKISHKNEKYEIFLSHYGHRVWPKSHHGSYHLFGHSHSRLPSYGYSFDAGVDCHNYFPISLDDVVRQMKKQKLETQEIRTRNHYHHPEK